MGVPWVHKMLTRCGKFWIGWAQLAPEALLGRDIRSMAQQYSPAELRVYPLTSQDRAGVEVPADIRATSSSHVGAREVGDAGEGASSIYPQRSTIVGSDLHRGLEWRSKSLDSSSSRRVPYSRGLRPTIKRRRSPR